MKVVIKDINDERTIAQIAEFQAPLRIEIEHGNSIYSVGEDNFGKLYIRCISETQLVLRTKASNCVEVDSE